MQKSGLFLLVALTTLSVYAQSDTIRWVVIRDIQLEGNDRTEDFVVYENLTFAPGDSLQITELLPTLRENRILLDKTTLFTDVTLKTENYKEDSLTVRITLKERWYYLIAPKLALGDRNFNVWWIEYNRELSRLIFGGSAAANNLSGRSDQLKFTALFGFNHHYGIAYRNRYASRKFPWGYEVGYDYVREREVAYNTIEDKLVYLRTGHQFNARQHRVSTGITWRINPHVRTSLRAVYRHQIISDTIVTLNPDYFGDGRTSRKWWTFEYQLISDHTDHLVYPRSGTKGALKLALQDPGKGGMNRLVVKPSVTHYHRLSSRVSIGGKAGLQVAAGSEQPYFLQQALGYDPTLVRGYEYYVVDGQHYVLLQTEAKWLIWDLHIPGSAIPIKQIREIPIEVFLKPHLDAGRVWDNFYADQNTLGNEWIWGGGIGIDVVTYYDYVISFNWSITRSLENGLYLHINF